MEQDFHRMDRTTSQLGLKPKDYNLPSLEFIFLDEDKDDAMVLLFDSAPPGHVALDAVAFCFCF